jgi:hypothetical protein
VAAPNPQRLRGGPGGDRRGEPGSGCPAGQAVSGRSRQLTSLAAVVVDAVGGVTLSNRTVFGLATEAPIGIRQLAWPPLPSVFTVATGERDCPNRVDAPAARAAYVIAWGHLGVRIIRCRVMAAAGGPSVPGLLRPRGASKVVADQLGWLWRRPAPERGRRGRRGREHAPEAASGSQTQTQQFRDRHPAIFRRTSLEGQ